MALATSHPVGILDRQWRRLLRPQRDRRIDPRRSPRGYALLSERFAQLYTEGFRMQDLYRFNLVTAKLGPGRLIKLPLSVTEANNNPNIRIGGGKCPGIS